MREYEYKVVRVYPSITQTEDTVNDFAKEGWRLVGVDTHLLYFERKFESKQQINEG